MASQNMGAQHTCIDNSSICHLTAELNFILTKNDDFIMILGISSAVQWDTEVSLQQEKKLEVDENHFTVPWASRSVLQVF